MKTVAQIIEAGNEDARAVVAAAQPPRRQWPFMVQPVPRCKCDLELTLGELETGRCASCGGAVL